MSRLSSVIDSCKNLLGLIEKFCVVLKLTLSFT